MKSDGSEKSKNTNSRPFEILHILSDANRLQVHRNLAENGELCAREILEFFPITQPTLSHHMNVLLENRMILSRKSGRWVFYRISDSCLDDLISFFLSLKERAATHDQSPATITKTARQPVKKELPLKKPMVESVVSPSLETKKKKSKLKEEKEKKKSKKKKKDKKKTNKE